MWWWWRWARTEGLPPRDALPYYAEFLIAELAMVAVHELGHTLTGKALGMRLRAFIVGPFQWRVQEGRWKFQLNLAGFLSTGGATAVVPSNPHQSRRNEVWMIAGGPLASFLGGLAGLWALLAARTHVWSHEWRLLALFTTLSLVTAAVNLLPFQTSAFQYSDGAQMYQLLSGGPWGDYHHAMGIVGATTVTPLRPRDYDIGALERAETAIRSGPRGLLLHLLRSSYYLDHGRAAEASHALNRAEEVYHESASDIPAELHTSFIFRKAYLQRDAEGTRTWWARMEAKKPKRFNADYWLARSAYLWMEGRWEEARDAWEKGHALAEELPKFGAYEFDRYRYALLRKELDAERRVPRWHEDLALTLA
jgi:hypothetical protein